MDTLKSLRLAALISITATSCAFGSVFVIDEGLDNSGLNSNIGTGNDNGKAANFVMGSGSDYILDSIVLGLGSVGNDEDPIVQLWSDDGTSAPMGTLLETLNNPVTLVNGANTFTSIVGTTLTAGSTYWVVVRNDANAFDWLGNNVDTSVTSDIGATHTARLFPANSDRSTPGTWDGSSSVLNQIQVIATAVPEPASAVFFGLVTATFVLTKRRFKKAL